MATISPLQSQFVNTVVKGFIESTGNSNLTLMDWIDRSLFNPVSSQDDVNSFARGELENFRASHPKTDSKRYQFRKLTPSEELLKVVFDEGFKHNPHLVIQDAEKLEGSFYPRWKKSVAITLPDGIAFFFGNMIVKGALTVASSYFSYKIGYAAYDKMVQTLNNRVIPFTINNTPAALAKLVDQSSNHIVWARQNKIMVFLAAIMIQKMILAGPRIPYFTPAVRAIDFWNLAFTALSSPLELFFTIIKTCLYTAGFTFRNCNDISYFFTQISMTSEKEYLTVTQTKSYGVWKKVIGEMTPKR